MSGSYNEWTYTKAGGRRGDWKCHLCQYNLATKKITYTGGLVATGFKIVCNDCIEMDCGRDYFSIGCEVTIHKERIES